MPMLFALSLLAALPGQAATSGEIRQAATRAIQLMQASQQEWDDGWSCASCHHQYLPAIAFQAAREHGIAVDEKIARADAGMAFRGVGNLDNAVQGSRSIEPSIGDAYRLWAAEASGVHSNLAVQADVRMMAARQKADGHWATMDQRPPQSYSPFTATALAIRSLKRYSHPAQSTEVREHIGRARAWLQKNQPGDTEGLVFQLLGLVWAGDAPLESVKAKLLHAQQSDGGWSSIPGRTSDAYSTGEALVALAEAGGPPPASDRGIAFLVRTQQKDGSWHVGTRLHPPAPLSPEYFESGYPYEHDQYLSMLGASWAVLALSRALGPARPPARPVVDGPELRWTQTVLFGSPEELKRLLDSGFDPNSATAEGTTALMMAVPDAVKVKLLLDRGAVVNAAARSRFTALDVAAQVRESGPVIRLLLEKGAERNEKPDPAGVHSLVLAASAGNVEALAALKAAGASVDDPMILGSVLYATPLLISSMTGDTDAVRVLLDLGAEINKPDREGLTALTWAVLANRVEVVRLLLDRHADPNRVDQYGMTALLYAASVDYGDSTVLDLLLQHGAHKDDKTKEGLTALDRARLFGHQRFLDFLGAGNR